MGVFYDFETKECVGGFLHFSYDIPAVDIAI